MVRKCDTAKYRKRRLRERLNTAARQRRLCLQEAQFWEMRRKAEAKAKAAWLADPRRQVIQQLVNILYARLCSNPLYQVIQIGKASGVDCEAMLSAATRGDDSFSLPPGYVWLKEGSPGSGRYA